MNANCDPQRLIFGASSGLRAVLYRSRATPLGAWLLESGAMERFVARNAARQLTGYIHHEDGVFYQRIEGEAAAVARVWHAIQNDPRHEAVTVLHLGPIPARRFARWAMGFNDGAKRSLHDWAARSGLSLKGRYESHAVAAFLEYASGAGRPATA